MWRKPREKQRPVASHWQTWSHNVVLEYTLPWVGFKLQLQWWWALIAYAVVNPTTIWSQSWRPLWRRQKKITLNCRHCPFNIVLIYRKTNLTIKQVYLVVFLSLSHFLIKYWTYLTWHYIVYGDWSILFWRINCTIPVFIFFTIFPLFLRHSTWYDFLLVHFITYLEQIWCFNQRHTWDCITHLVIKWSLMYDLSSVSLKKFW